MPAPQPAPAPPPEPAPQPAPPVQETPREPETPEIGPAENLIIKVGLAVGCAAMLVMTVGTEAWMLVGGMTLAGVSGALIWLPVTCAGVA